MSQQQSLGMQEHPSHPWKSATHFQCLTSLKTQIKGCFCQLNTQTVQFWGLQRSLKSLICTRRETGNLPSPKGAGSKCKGTQGRSTAPEAAAEQCPESHSGMLRTKTNTSAPWGLGGTAQGAVTHYEIQNDWVETKPKRTQTSQLRITKVGVGDRR